MSVADDRWKATTRIGRRRMPLPWRDRHENRQEDAAEAGVSATPPPSDQSLLRRFQLGQSDASTLLYLRYAERLYHLAASQTSPDLARRSEPEEIVQSVFRTFFRRAAEGHYQVPEGEEIWKLLLVIALNKVRTAGAFHRAAKRDVRHTIEGKAYEKAIASSSSQDEISLCVLRMVIDQVLDQLTPVTRKMVELRIEGYEVAEIAQSVERSRRSVERVLQDFRKRLGALVRDEQET
jgi:RNA polymerase sigma-70 factor, ECF subfamily